MLVGIPKEVKDQENRVGATPELVRSLIEAGHNVCVQEKAGKEIGFSDVIYKKVGAKIVKTAKEVYACDMVIKVKEPVEEEYPYLREGLILFCYLHLAAAPQLTQVLIDQKVVAVAYETVTDEKGHLPLLIPMSEIAGRLSIQTGAACLQMVHGGKGVLLGGAPGVPSGNVVVLGGGVAGCEAVRMAVGIGAHVTVLDQNLNRLRQLQNLFGSRVHTLYSTPHGIEKAILNADLIVGAVLIPGASAPKLLTKELIASLEKGSVVVDISIDQGGCFATSKPTTHTNPTYEVDGVIHYCVTNMPGACARTATRALTNATMQYALEIANKGYRKAFQEHTGLRNGLNVCEGKVTNENVARDLGYEYIRIEQVLP